MKIVKNICYGGFSLSPLAVKELAKRKKKQCYFFKLNYRDNTYIPITLKEASKSLMWLAYTVPNPQDYRLDERDADGLYGSANKRAKEISIEDTPQDRTDKDLIAVVEKLGKRANGSHAELAIVEVPDGTEWEIDDYDGVETITEKHRSW